VNPRVVAGASAVVLALAGALTSSFEGRSHTVYMDRLPALAIPTVCDGHTGPDVVIGKVYTDAECDALRQQDLLAANAIVRRCVDREMPPKVEAAVTDFTLNVGAGRAGKGADRGKDGFCVLRSGKPSTMRVLANAGDWAGVCRQFMAWTTSNGVEYGGLIKRRRKEQALCESGL